MVFSLFLGTAYMLLCNNGIAPAGLQLVGYLNISAELSQLHNSQFAQNAPEGPV